MNKIRKYVLFFFFVMAVVPLTVNPETECVSYCMDKQGSIVFETRYFIVSSFSEGLACIQEDGDSAQV